MIEDEEMKKYISNINKIIRNGNPKYLSFVSKEYMKYKKNNPVVAMVIEDMIRKEAAEQGSIYAIFINNNNEIDLDAMSDISMISNIPDFIKNVEALAGQNVDFGDLTSEELIIEGMDIAEEIAREIENLENEIDYSDEMADVKLEEQGEQKTSDTFNKLSKTGIATVSLLSIINKIKEKISLTITKVKTNIMQKREIQEVEEKKEYKEVKKDEIDFIPKFDIDEEAAINKMKENKKSVKKTRNIENFDSSPNDDDFDSDDDNTSQEDDEPDI